MDLIDSFSIIVTMSKVKGQKQQSTLLGMSLGIVSYAEQQDGILVKMSMKKGQCMKGLPTFGESYLNIKSLQMQTYGKQEKMCGLVYLLANVILQHL